ncbi:MAG: MFS transporter [Pseudomonadota bacterium]
MFADPARRNVLVLACCQALVMIGTTTMIAEAALIGHMLAENKALATLPISLQQLGVMLATFPASFLMRRVGRRAGLSVGACFGIVGMSIATAAILSGSFAWFCVGAALNGVYNSFALYYRFAAVDGAGAWRSKAVSYVLAGGVVAALAGPELAKYTKDLMAPVVYAGSFAALIGVAILALAALQFIDIPPPSAAALGEKGRPLAEIVRQPLFVVAAAGGMVGYGGMSFIMTATPLAMMVHDHSFASAAFVIQWHAVAMFAPSFVTGQIIDRFGLYNVMLAGGGLVAASAAINLTGVTLAQFWIGLVLLGLGWNFLYVGATTLLTQAYRLAERAVTQAANEFLVFGAVTLASLSSGAVHHAYGWDVLNYALLPFLAVTMAATFWLSRQSRPLAA